MAKRTPDQLKIIAGTARPDRMNPDAPDANIGTASAPEWLSERASELFAQLSATLLGMGIASPDDQAALAMLASRLEEVEICTAVIEGAGRTYSTTATSGDKLIRARPEVAMRNEAMRHAQSLLSDFGLTPAARSKVSVAKLAEENPFAALEFGF
ncbi:phage terminase small subunit P27 family [Roseovarius spongiae]|uniref:Phage terminase small subunit P27 family n=1 Tax=Roseovarius spongiae TaxID=2320272 RepID=A0A3A8AWZ1_9RHOB|nr:phage terminase small subunit P27 family [Roseovarius spongiae]RKF16913.1 phage terminase small subunit P27 family [Roseovarius spongiae]